MAKHNLSPLAFVADLDVEVGDERGSTTAHLTTDDYGLVLEVVDPATLLRCVPGRGLRRDLPFSVPLVRLANVPVRLTSRGPELGRVHITPAGRVRLRPTLSGVPALARTAASYGPARLVAAAATFAGLGIVAYLARRRATA